MIEITDSFESIEQKEIARLESELGVSLPRDFVKFLRAHNGGKVNGVFYQGKEVDEGLEVVRFHSLGIGVNPKFQVSVCHEIQEFPEEYYPVVSFAMGSGCSLYLSCSARHKGKIIAFNTAHCLLVAVIESFSTFMDGLVQTSEYGLWTDCKNEPWVAAEVGDWGKLEKAIENGFDLESLDPAAKIGFSALGVATANLRLDVVRRLLERGASPNTKGSNGMTPVHLAAYVAGSRQIMSELLNSGGDLSVRDCDGNTPLHLMIQHNASIDDFKWILDLGSDCKIENNDGRTVADLIKRKMEQDPVRWKQFLDLVEITI